MITITKDHLKQGHRVRPGTKITVQYICIHSTGNPSSTAKNERAWLDNPSNDRQASWNYCIDEKDCIEAIPPGEEAWAQQSGNKSCISIEICESGNRTNTVERAAEFAAQLLKERGWGIDKLRRHNDFYSSKICPAIFYKNGSWAQWEDFKKKVDGYLKGTTQTVTSQTTKPIAQGKVTATSLYIRPEANTNKTAIGSLKQNEVVDIYGEEGNFYKLVTGYASKDYIEILPTKSESVAPSTNNTTVPEWKLAELDYLKAEGIEFDYDLWKTKIDEPMPAWAIFIFMARMHRNLKNNKN